MNEKRGAAPLIRSRRICLPIIVGLWALDSATASGLSPVVLVLGREAGAVLSAALGEAPLPPDLTVVGNDLWASGIASSLRAAIAALEPMSGIDAVVVGLGDQPAVGAEAYRRLASSYDAGARLAVATYGAARANPVLVARGHWSEALALENNIDIEVQRYAPLLAREVLHRAEGGGALFKS